MKGENLFCTDGSMQTAVATYSKKQWTILGVDHGEDQPEFTKVLFNMTFDDIEPFNSFSGVSYVAVKKDNLWGLIRFRQDSKNNENYKKALGNELIDKDSLDIFGREIKIIEEIKYPDINSFKDKYNLSDKYGFNKEYLIGLSEWYDNHIDYNRDTFSNQEFGCDSKGNVRMKRYDGTFGYIPIADALDNKYNVHHDEDDDIIYIYENISEMVEDGWALD